MKKLKIKIIDWLFKGTNKIYEGYNDPVKELEENYLFDFKNYSSQYYNPDIWNNSSEEKLLQFKRAGIKKLVVMSLEEFELLNNNLEGIEIEIFLFCCLSLHLPLQCL